MVSQTQQMVQIFVDGVLRAKKDGRGNERVTLDERQRDN